MQEQASKRIGILTGGGDAPGLNAVIRAAAKTAIKSYGWSVIGFLDGFEGSINGRYRELTFDSVRGILTRGGTILGTSNRCNPFWFKNPDCGDTEPRDYSQVVISHMRNLDIDALVVVGGDGTLSIAGEFNRLGLPTVGVPKTIDNDVRGTDVTFGFDTAVNTVSDALDKLHTTAESHHRVMVVEVMGRTAGWIALYAGVAGGADVILMPEIPFDMEEILTKIRLRVADGHHFTIIVVAEGAAPRGGEAIYERIGSRDYEIRFGGIGSWLMRELEVLVHQEVRSVVLGHLQRGGGPTPRDRLLGTVMGSAAIDLIARGHLGQMVSVIGEGAGPGRPAVASVPLSEPGRGPRLVPLDHPLLVAAERMGTCLGRPTPRAQPAGDE